MKKGYIVKGVNTDLNFFYIVKEVISSDMLEIQEISESGKSLYVSKNDLIIVSNVSCSFKVSKEIVSEIVCYYKINAKMQKNGMIDDMLKLYQNSNKMYGLTKNIQFKIASDLIKYFLKQLSKKESY